MTFGDGLSFKFVRSTRKEHSAECCGKPIFKGSSCINASGKDYDGFFTNWYVHLDRKCYLFLVDNIDMVGEGDITELIPKDMIAQ